jgi:nucleotide-binding universal stress UspA family protein
VLAFLTAREIIFSISYPKSESNLKPRGKPTVSHLICAWRIQGNQTLRPMLSKRAAMLISSFFLPPTAKRATALNPILLSKWYLRPVASVLILPFKGIAEIKFEDVMLSWNDSREAARAAFDALPFMKHSKQTKIVTVDNSPSGPIAGANIAETLDRDGLKCEVVNVASGGKNPGATLLLAANDHGAGLLILGVYGYTLLTE